ncbi:MAG: hypothetical protein CM1200mP3_12890 [Chloroflexota bacterium]|nr:MAG: hypothetical protein CM1200mP3_12890 [Chloroflexota bacterium]
MSRVKSPIRTNTIAATATTAAIRAKILLNSSLVDNAKATSKKPSPARRPAIVPIPKDAPYRECKVIWQILDLEGCLYQSVSQL